jgi:hypothetical protein
VTLKKKNEKALPVKPRTKRKVFSAFQLKKTLKTCYFNVHPKKKKKKKKKP